MQTVMKRETLYVGKGLLFQEIKMLTVYAHFASKCKSKN